MNANELLNFFISLYPHFSEWWDAENNYSRRGDEFTVHGVCNEFSQFYQEQTLPLEPNITRSLFEKIEQIVAADLKTGDSTANALYTCFLENISHTDVGEASIPYMGIVSRELFDPWHEGFALRRKII
jgi:hypothetical protein